MKDLAKNRAFITLTGADLFETIGVSLFNVALLLYAKTFSQATLLVSIVSVATVLPAPLGIITGRLADRVGDKRVWLVASKFIQAGLYLGLSILITRRTVSIFMVIILINIVSDLLGAFSTSLRMPLIQAKVNRAQQEQATGVNQGIVMLMQTVGQALGVSLLAVTHDYQLTGLVNAGTFLLAGGVLLLGFRSLKVTLKPAGHQTWRRLARQIKQVFELSAGINVVGLLMSIMLLNAVGASIDAVLNLFLLRMGSRLPLPFSVSVWVLNTLFIGGTILGNLLHTGWFQRWSFKTVDLGTIVVLAIIYLNLWWWQNYWVLIIGMLIAGFGMGQMNPKLYANLMKVAEPEFLGSLTGVLNSLATLSVPIGSIGIVMIYNVVSSVAAEQISLGLLILSATCLLIPAKPKVTRM